MSAMLLNSYDGFFLRSLGDPLHNIKISPRRGAVFEGTPGNELENYTDNVDRHLLFWCESVRLDK